MAVERITSIPEQSALPLSLKELPQEQREIQSKRLFFYLGGICSREEEIQKNLRSTPVPLGTPFSFNQIQQRSNYEIHAKLENIEENEQKKRKLSAKTRFSLSGPMIDLNGAKIDNGPFIEERAEICPEENTFEYFWSISDGSVEPEHYLNSQKAVEKILSFGVMLGNSILKGSKK